MMDGMLLCAEHFELRLGGFCQKCFGQLGHEPVILGPKGKYHAQCLRCPCCGEGFSPGRPTRRRSSAHRLPACWAGVTVCCGWRAQACPRSLWARRILCTRAACAASCANRPRASLSLTPRGGRRWSVAAPAAMSAESRWSSLWTGTTKLSPRPGVLSPLSCRCGRAPMRLVWRACARVTRLALVQGPGFSTFSATATFSAPMAAPVSPPPSTLHLSTFSSSGGSAARLDSVPLVVRRCVEFLSSTRYGEPGQIFPIAQHPLAHQCAAVAQGAL